MLVINLYLTPIIRAIARRVIGVGSRCLVQEECRSVRLLLIPSYRLDRQRNNREETSMTAQLRKYRWFGALVGLWLTIGNAPVWALTVESTGDSGGICPGATCTLRQAIVDTPSGGTVDFNMPLPNVIELVSEQLTLNKNLTIIGPGADQLAIYGNLRF